MKNLIAPLALAAVTIGIALALFLLVTAGNPFSTRETVVINQFKQYRAAAEVYRGRYETYEQMCREVVLGVARCRSTEDAYVIYQGQEDGTFFCTDSTRFAGTIPRAPSKNTCQ